MNWFYYPPLFFLSSMSEWPYLNLLYLVRSSKIFPMMWFFQMETYGQDIALQMISGQGRNTEPSKLPLREADLIGNREFYVRWVLVITTRHKGSTLNCLRTGYLQTESLPLSIILGLLGHSLGCAKGLSLTESDSLYPRNTPKTWFLKVMPDFYHPELVNHLLKAGSQWQQHESLRAHLAKGGCGPWRWRQWCFFSFSVPRPLEEKVYCKLGPLDLQTSQAPSQPQVVVQSLSQGRLFETLWTAGW